MNSLSSLFVLLLAFCQTFLPVLGNLAQALGGISVLVFVDLCAAALVQVAMRAVAGAANRFEVHILFDPLGFSGNCELPMRSAWVTVILSQL